MVGPVRLFLAFWLVAFGAQSTGVFAMVAPDACVEDAGAAGDDNCPDTCARCACCARMPVNIAPLRVAAPNHARPVRVTTTDHLTSGVPRGVLHIPKPLI